MAYCEKYINKRLQLRDSTNATDFCYVRSNGPTDCFSATSVWPNVMSYINSVIGSRDLTRVYCVNACQWGRILFSSPEFDENVRIFALIMYILITL